MVIAGYQVGGHKTTTSLSIYRNKGKCMHVQDLKASRKKAKRKASSMGQLLNM